MSVLSSLENVSEDITEAVYLRLQARCPDAWELMAHTDQYIRGRMLQQTIELLIDEATDLDYLTWEVNNHVLSYAVESDMYPHFLHSIRETIQASSTSWTKADEQDWNNCIDRLLSHIADLQTAG